MTLHHLLIEPFSDPVMRRAVAAIAALSLGGTPLGVFLVQRRMTLVGDVLSHAILPGIAVSFFLYGLSPLPMVVGGMVAGLLVAFLAGSITRLTSLKEDASFMGAYLISVALGVLILSLRGGTEEIVHVLFGDVFKIGNASLLLMAGIAGVTLALFMLLYRLLIVECFDPDFLRVTSRSGALAHYAFLTLMVLNLVAAFQALGTLMALGLMVLPVLTARFWSGNIDRVLGLSVALAFLCGTAGLIVAYDTGTPPGSIIVLAAGSFYAASLLFGRNGGIVTQRLPGKHLAG